MGRGPDAFVTTLYREGLNRTPEHAGLVYWSKHLANGARPRSVASTIWNSREHRALVREHRDPRISLRHALGEALQAWKHAAHTGMVHPTGAFLLPFHTAAQ